MQLSIIYYAYLYGIISLSLLLSIRSSSNQHALLVLFLITFFFFAFRDNAGFDFPYYVDMIYKWDGIEIFEPIPYAVALFANKIEVFQIFIIYTSLPFVLGCVIFSSLSGSTFAVYLIFAMLLWLPFGFFEHFSWVRQSAAIGFFLIALYFYEKNLIKWGVVFSGLSLLNHFSVMPYFIFYFVIANVSIKIKCLAIKLFFLIVFFELSFSMLSNLILTVSDYLPYANYLSKNSEYGTIGFITWMIIVLMPSAFFFFDKNIFLTFDKSFNFLAISLFGGVLYTVMYPYGQHASRAFMLVAPISCYIFVSLLEKLFDNRILLIGILLLSTVGLTYRLIASASVQSDYDYLNNYKVNIR